MFLGNGDFPECIFRASEAFKNQNLPAMVEKQLLIIDISRNFKNVQNDLFN